MATGTIKVDLEELRSAAASIRRVVENGTAEYQCFSWGDGYGHDGLAQAIQMLVSDVDLAVDSHAARAELLAAGLDEQIKDYEAAEAEAGSCVANLSAQLPHTGWRGPSPLGPGLAPSPVPAFPFTSAAG
ncbi:hypothetical protein ACFUMH_07465 [Cellulomonas sp. NPDC057328]|uniref:hypothetical protein n=1 Tax=Cellulomonas sp. NPDC057328 TaxID=3346101 RepID=UPI003629DBC7